MPTRKSKPRTSTVRRRIEKYKETYRHKIVPLQYKKQIDAMASGVEEWLVIQDELEKQVLADLESKAGS